MTSIPSITYFCRCITINVQNALTKASWRVIVEQLHGKGVSKYIICVIECYLCARELLITNKDRMYMSSGGPQGPAQGPTLWNDPVLRITLEACQTIAYADDLA